MTWRAAVRAYDIDVEVTVRGQSEALVAELLASFPAASGPAALRYRVDDDPDPALLGERRREPTLFRDGVPVYSSWYAIDLGPAFEIDLYRQLVARAEGLLLLHAAAVVIGDRAVVLAGDSGAGKSTMAQALIERGAAYITDEYVGIDAGGGVQGIPRPLTPTDGVLPAVVPPGFRAASYRMRRSPTGELAEHGFMHPPRVAHGPAPLAALVLLRHAPGEPSGGARLASGPALERLWSCAHRSEPATLAIATALLGGHPAYQLVTHTIEGACDDLAALLEG